MTEPVELIGDIGGTNARFALMNPRTPADFTEVRTLTCADFDTPEAAIQAYLSCLDAPAPSRIYLAAAGPVVNGEVRFTNNPWTLRQECLQQSFATAQVRLVNDFEAMAHALPWLSPEVLLPLGTRVPSLPPAAGFRFAVVGPGTGLGAAALIDTSAGPAAIVSEAGHLGFAPESPLQDDLAQALRQRFERLSAERFVSGPGVENLYWALAQVREQDVEPKDAATIFAAAGSDEDPVAVEAVALFHELLGQVAGDIALAFGTRDGVFVAGGVARQVAEDLAASHFRNGFENKGRHRALLETLPTALIVHEYPGLLGAATLLRQAREGSLSPA